MGLTDPVTVRDPLETTETPDASPHDSPDAHTLIDAVGVFLAGAEQPDDRLRFHARVAASALRIARRELLLAETHRTAHENRLKTLDCETDIDLAKAIRDGTLDDRMDEAVAAVRASLIDKLTVANPRHLSLPG
jgi:hypothetical protein